MKRKTNTKYSIRILLSPFIFLYYYFMLLAGTVIPIILMGSVISLLMLLMGPFIWALQQAEVEIKYPEPFLIEDKYYLGNFLMLTIYIWGPFYATYIFITTGKLIATD